MSSAIISGLEQELLDMIIKVCNITDPVPDDLTVDSPLIDPDAILGLDSLDALEIAVMVQETYNVRIRSQDDSRLALTSLKSLADYIREKSR